MRVRWYEPLVIVLGILSIIVISAILLSIYWNTPQTATPQISSEQHILNNMDNFHRAMQADALDAQKETTGVLEEGDRHNGITLYNGQTWQTIRPLPVETPGIIRICSQGDGTWKYCPDDNKEICLRRLYAALTDIDQFVNHGKLVTERYQALQAETISLLEECRP